MSLKTKAISQGRARIVFVICNYIFLSVTVLITIYPVLYVLAASLSSYEYLSLGKVTIFPMGFNIAAYKRVMSYPLITTAYANTIFYTLGWNCNKSFLDSSWGISFIQEEIPR